mmetsp:Transcript_8540/g.12631  ORF Transcript_8540/g.12631 Transcript_8540/m.12631 type:complete len:474 (-) Transcript_8540:440-1861(-)
MCDDGTAIDVEETTLCCCKPLISLKQAESGVLAFEVEPPDYVLLGKSREALSKSKVLRHANGSVIRSSGYGLTQVKMSLGQGPTMAKKQAMKRLNGQKLRKQEQALERKLTAYPVKCGLLTSHQPQHDESSSLEPSALLPPVASIAFDTTSSLIATSHHDCSLNIFKLPFVKYGPPSNQITNEIAVPSDERPARLPTAPTFSFHNHLIAYHNCIYNIGSDLQNMNINNSSAPLLKLPGLATNAQFFYKDKFILFSNNGRLSCNHIHLGKQPTFKISQKPTLGWSFSGTITSIASINNFFSDIIAVASNDRCIRVLDAESGSIAWCRADQRSQKAFHSIAFPNPVSSSHLSPETFNLLAGASILDGGTISLYDLRAAKEICSFRGHLNRKERCGISFSPCMRYIASGSEAVGGAVLYDLRRPDVVLTKIGTKTAKGRPLLDGTTTSVAFNPRYPQVVTGSLGGRLRFFTEQPPP